MIRLTDLVYRAGYEYQLERDCSFQLPISFGIEYEDAFIKLTKDGVLVAKANYAWDGPSGPTFDTPDFMAGSLVHDELYQLMREGVLNTEQCRKIADETLIEVCKEDGMGVLRRGWVYAGVRIGAAQAAKKKTPIYTIPLTPEGQDAKLVVSD